MAVKKDERTTSFSVVKYSLGGKFSSLDGSYSILLLFPLSS